jgi:predicted ferric reductase
MFWRKLAFWTFAMAFPLPLVLTYDELQMEPPALRIDIFLGLFAYAWWLLAILLSLRPPWLERMVGLPSIYGLHGMLGVLAIVAAHLHSDQAYADNALAGDLGTWGFWAALAVLLYSAFFLSGWLVDRSRMAQSAKQLLEVVLRRQVSLWIHRLNLAIVVMIFVHAHLLVRVNQHLALMVLFDVYTVVTLSVYAWKKWIARDTYVTGTVVANEARGTATRVLSIALDREATTVRPGDSFFVRFEGSAAVGREWHPFSVTDDDRRTLTFTISQRGDYTRRLSSLQRGTRVRLEGPFGRFETIARGLDTDTPLVLLGMGAGVAPLLSLTAAHHTSRDIHLLWAVRRAEDAHFTDVLAGYQAAAGDRLQVTTNVGRFRREDLAGVLSPEAVEKGAFFIVGPNPAVLANQRLLRRLGVSPRRIHHERLTM